MKYIVMTQFAMLLFLTAAQVQAARLDFSGSLVVVETDNQEGIFSGIGVGAEFTGFVDDASLTGEISHTIPATAEKEAQIISTAFSLDSFSQESGIVVDEEALAGLEFIPVTVPVTLGQEIDFFSFGSFNQIAEDRFLTVGIQLIFEGGRIGDGFSESTTLPTNLEDPLWGLFGIIEGGTEESYAAFGVIDAVAFVPLPAPILLLISGLAAFWRIQRRNV